MSTRATANVGYGFKFHSMEQVEQLSWFSSKYGWTDMNIPPQITAVDPGIYAQRDSCTLSWIFIWTESTTTVDYSSAAFNPFGCQMEHNCKKWMEENIPFPLIPDWFVYLSS